MQLWLAVIASLCLSLPAICAAPKKPLPQTSQTSTPAVAGDNEANDDSNPPPTAKELAAPTGGKLILSEYEFWLSAEVLVFGFAVLLAEFLLLRKAKITAEEALRVYAVSLIIIGTLFAITAGFDSNQIAPAMGLFGTIAGYLLGKRVPDRIAGSTETQQ